MFGYCYWTGSTTERQVRWFSQCQSRWSVARCALILNSSSRPIEISTFSACNNILCICGWLFGVVINMCIWFCRRINRTAFYWSPHHSWCVIQFHFCCVIKERKKHKSSLYGQCHWTTVFCGSLRSAPVSLDLRRRSF